MKKKTIEIPAVTLLLISLVLGGCSENDSQNNQASEQPAPADAVINTAKTTIQADGISAPLEFTLTDLTGQAVKAANFRGQWLVLNYWATWCGPCRDEMPELVRFQAENPEVQILGIAYEDAEVAKLQNFAADFNINYPLLTIDVYNPPEFAQEGGLGLPTTIVYNPQGMRHKKHMGPIDAEGLVEMLQ